MATRGLGPTCGEHADFAEKDNSRVAGATRFTLAQASVASLKKWSVVVKKKLWF